MGERNTTTPINLYSVALNMPPICISILNYAWLRVAIHSAFSFCVYVTQVAYEKPCRAAPTSHLFPRLLPMRPAQARAHVVPRAHTALCQWRQLLFLIPPCPSRRRSPCWMSRRGHNHKRFHLPCRQSLLLLWRLCPPPTKVR